MSFEGSRIEVSGLTKRFGSFTAVDDLSFSVEPGVVTGFLGPNGAGKTTTLRCLLGLIQPDAGSVTIDGRSYAELSDPLGTVGAALEAASFHPGRTARKHLEVMALAAGIAPSRAVGVLRQVGLDEAMDKRVGGYSMGMRQRLGLAGALLGDPRVLILDEPANGLDPAGIAWLRNFLRTLAAEGRTVLISSHVLSEVQQTVEDVVVLTRGRLVRTGKLSDLDSGPHAVWIRTPQAAQFATLLTEAGYAPTPHPDGLLEVPGLKEAEAGRMAFEAGIETHHLSEKGNDLEKVFLELTQDGASEEAA